MKLQSSSSPYSILIIGSKGFIGSALFKSLSSQGKYDVYGCDLAIDYGNTKYFQVEPGSVNYDVIIKQLPNLTAVINCSGAASVPDSLARPLRDFRLNVLHVVMLLESLRLYSPHTKFLNLSSAAIYGNPASLPIPETHLAAPVSPYGSHKQMAELVCQEYFDHFKIPTCSIRIFSAYGPGLRKQLFWDLAHKSISNGRVELFGTGSETRDFIYIDDLLSAILAIVSSDSFTGGALNAGSGLAIPIASVAEQFYQRYRPGVQVVFNQQVRLGDPLHWQADISQLSALGFIPAVSIGEGVRRVADWLLNEADDLSSS